MQPSFPTSLLRRFGGAIAALVLLTSFGAFGYGIIEGLTVVDAIYMAVITISTVGFGEVDPLSPAGRLFAVFLIIAGGGLAAVALTSTAEFVLSGDLGRYLKHRREIRMLSQLKDHTIVCGYGRVGRHVCDELHAQGIPFVVVDTEAERVNRVHQLGYLAMQGNGANEQDLRTAGIERAKSLITAASSDAENVFITLTARSMREDLLIVARANYDDSEGKLLRAGANRVLLPYRICGRRMATLLVRPGVADFLDEVMHAANLELLIDHVVVAEQSALIGQTLSTAHLRGRFGITVIAVRQPGTGYNTAPNANTSISAGIDLIVMGTREHVQAFARIAAEAIT